MKTYFDLLQERQHSPVSRLSSVHDNFDWDIGWNCTVYSLFLYVKGQPARFDVHAHTLSMMVVE